MSALDEHLHRAPEESLGPLRGAPLHDLDKPFHALHLHRVGNEPLGDRAASVPRRGEKMNVKAPS